MKKILISLATVAVVGVVAVGATRAYFTSSATSTGNTFTAATLGLKVNNENGPTVIHFNRSGLQPNPRWSKNYGGDFVLKNDGTIPGKVTMQIVNIKNLENGCGYEETAASDSTCGTTPDQGELGDLTFVNFARNVAPWGSFGGYAPLNSATEGSAINGPTLNPGESIPVNMDFEWDTHAGTVDNTGQSDSVEFDVVFTLEQIHP